MRKVTDFIHLHCHTEYSMLDGMPKVEEYLRRCSELDLEGIALTEHGNMRSVVQLFQKSKGGKIEIKKREQEAQGEIIEVQPIKPIAGIEFYLSHLDHRIKGPSDSEKNMLRLQSEKSKESYKTVLSHYERVKGYRKRYHVLAFAKNDTGLKNLYMLHYLSWKDGFYYRPRIDLKLLLKYRDGLVITSACIGSPVNQYIIRDDEKNAVSFIKIMKKYFGDDFYLEIQPHNIDDQRKSNIALVSYAQDYGIKLIATNDTHYLMKDDYVSHEVLLAIQSKQTMQSDDRWRFDDREFYIKSKDEMLATFKKNHPSISQKVAMIALENTVEIAEKCNVDMVFDTRKGILPNTNHLWHGSNSAKDRLIDIVKHGWKWRKMNKRISDYAELKGISLQDAKRVYTDRIKYELARIFKMEFEQYFLVVHDYISWCRKNDILTGPGRGSSGGSLVSFLMGITSMDSVRYDMLFDRFLDPQRTDYPDIDVDFQDDKRQQVVDYLKQRYGEENVSNIITIGKMKGKACLLDVARVFGIPSNETHAVTKHIITRSLGDARANQTVADSFKEFDICKSYDIKYPMVLKHVEQLEGKARQSGIHAAGVQVTPVPIHQLVPVEFVYKAGHEPIKITSLDYRDCQQLGLIKLDMLGLRTLTIIKDAMKSIYDRHGIKLDLESLDLEDKNILQGFTDRKFVGIFQFDSIGMTKTCRGLKFEKFEDVIAMNALYRPGTMRPGVTNSYIKRKLGKEKVRKLHPKFDEITKHTYGYIIYQEQMLQALRDIGKFRVQKANAIRKIVSKSVGHEALKKEKDLFIKGATENGMSKEDANKLFEDIAFFGSYAFNKAHAGSYSIISYWSMYMKLNYPTEFYYSLLKNESDMPEVIRFVNSAREDGINILMPDINYSKYSFAIDKDGNIRSGLIDIKGCGNKAAEEICKHYPYVSMKDFRSKINARVVNRGVVKSLVHAGAFKSIYKNTKALLYEFEVKKKKRDGTEFVEYTPAWQKLWDGKMSDAEFEKLSKGIVMSEEDEVTIQQGYCPIPSYKHKIDYYDDILGNLSIGNYCKISNIGKKKSVTVAGIIAEVKYNNVGDFHKEDPSELEKQRIGWGKRYCAVNIDDGTGILKVNLNIDIFPIFRTIIDKRVGTPVILYGSAIKDGDMVFVDFMADLDVMRDRIANSKIKPVDKLFIRGNRYIKFLLEKKRKKGLNGIISIHKAMKIKNGNAQVAGIITRIKEHWTKKDECMAFVDMFDGEKLNFIVWPSEYEANRELFKVGQLIEVPVYFKPDKNSNGTGCYMINGSSANYISTVYGISERAS